MLILSTHLSVAESTAISRAGTNNYTIDHGITQNNGTIAACGSASYVGFTDHYIDVTVDISATTQSNFLQIIFPEALHNEVAAVTRIRPRQPPAFGNAIVALNPDGCQGAGTPGGIMYGNTNILIEGGGIFSNGCLRGNGNPNITITGGPIPIGNELQPGMNADWTPDPEVTDLQTDPAQFDFGIPNCTGHTMDDLPNSKPPEPPLDGLYCLTGDLSLNSHDYITGTNVTIYIPNGKLTINGRAHIYLSAPDANNPPPNTDAIPGVLFYVPNGQAVELNGTSDSWFIGMILAPKSNVTLNGTSGNSYRGQVIGWNVNVGGTADVFIIYNPEEGYNIPTSMELAR